LAESVVIPRVAALHQLITESLLRKPFLLSGSEIRFLRKEAGIASKNLAAKLNITPEHLSRVENGKNGKKKIKKETLGPQADKLIRAIIAVSASQDEEASKLLLSEIELLAPERPVTFTVPLNHDHWGKMAIAQ
jgi:transcriptional regulator with XRE-family HTH domain